jgi:GT2 family glycosyltransferase
MFLDADDRLAPNALAALLGKTESGAVAVYGDYDRIDSEGRRLGFRHAIRRHRLKPTGDILARLVGGNFVAGGSMLVRREAVVRLGGFDERLALCEDWLLWCSLAALGRFTYVPGLHVFDYRIHHDSTMHRRARTFGELEPVLQLIFRNQWIGARLDPAHVPVLRQSAETSLRAYVATEAARLRNWSTVFGELVWALRRRPSAFPRLAFRIAAAAAGL